MTTSTSDCRAVRRLILLLAAVCGTACGLVDDSRSEDDKLLYLTFFDKTFEALCLGQYDLDGDGRLSRYEAQRVVALDCSGCGISSLADLREFPNLRELACRDNALRELDVHFLTHLERLDCRGNGLERLDVDGLRGLTSLQCSDNSLPQLDLASNASLAELDARSNLLLTLDVSNCSPTLVADVRANSGLATVYCLSTQGIASDGGTELLIR